MTKRGRPKHYQIVHKKAWTDKWGKHHKASSYKRKVPKRGVSPKTVRYREERKRLIKKFGGKCQICGTRSGLNFHHIRPTELYGVGRGSWERLTDVKRNPKSYRLLCNSCHKKFHKRYGEKAINGELLKEMREEVK